MTRILAILTSLALLAGCAAQSSLTDAPLADLGAFRLGHNVVVASKAQKGPVSREASEEEWVAALTKAVDERFSRYEGDQLYHFGLSVEGYLLAPPGVPLVYTPKSALIVNVTIWDDAANAKLNEKVHQITVFETTTGGSFLVGSGNKRTKEQQMAGLSENAVREIEKWMLEMAAEKGWFASRPGASTDAVVTPATE